MSSLTTACLGVLNGSSSSAITRAFRANRESMFAWRSSLLEETDPLSARSRSSRAGAIKPATTLSALPRREEHTSTDNPEFSTFDFTPRGSDQVLCFHIFVEKRG